MNDSKQNTIRPTPADAPRHRRRSWPIVATCSAILLLLGGIAGKQYFHIGKPVETGVDIPVSAKPTPYVAAAPAVVEPSTHLVAIRSERQGRIKTILKQAGDRIKRGEPLVLLDDATAKALVNQRHADLELAKANLARLKAWDRPEKIGKAKAGFDRAAARHDRAARELKRIRRLAQQAAASETELNQAIEEERLAAAALDEAKQVWTMSKAGPILEEIRVAEARVEQAQAALRMAEAELALRTLVSPLDGHVIYRHLEPGEVVNPESRTPILSVGNLDAVRLRAEIDEADIQRVKVGQRVVATAEAFGDQVITGRVVHLESMMGRKNIRTQRTTEQQDTKVREVLIELDQTDIKPPIDLQMTVRFIATDEADDEASPSPHSNP